MRIISIFLFFFFPVQSLAQQYFTEIKPEGSGFFTPGEIYFIKIECRDFGSESEMSWPHITAPLSFPQRDGDIKQFVFGMGWEGLTPILQSDDYSGRLIGPNADENSEITNPLNAATIAGSEITVDNYSFEPVFASALSNDGKSQIYRTGAARLCRNSNGFFFRYDPESPPRIETAVLATEDPVAPETDFLNILFQGLGKLAKQFNANNVNLGFSEDDATKVNSLYQAIRGFAAMFRSARKELDATYLVNGDLCITHQIGLEVRIFA